MEAKLKKVLIFTVSDLRKGRPSGADDTAPFLLYSMLLEPPPFHRQEGSNPCAKYVSEFDTILRAPNCEENMKNQGFARYEENQFRGFE